MSRKLLVTLLSLSVLTTLAGIAFVPTSLASRRNVSTEARNKPSGLTQRGIANTRESGAPSRVVTMQPQSSAALLQKAVQLGAHASDSTIELTVGLKLRNEAKLKTFLQQVQNPASPIYRQFLTPKQFTALYGPTKADVARVVSFLKARGIKVKDVSPNRTLIHTAATTAVYNHIFGIRINNYRLNGRRFYSTADSPKLPRAIAPLVANIIGLNNGVQMRPLSHMKALVTTHASPPATTAAFNPYQIAKAYDWPDITDPDNGAGVSIAILTALTPGVATNPNYHDFWTEYGLPDHTINVIPIDGASGSGGEGETALDIEWSGAMAPGATLNVYVAANGGPDAFTDMYNQFVTDNTSQVMTTSWGVGESGNPGVNVSNEQIFMQAAAQGISMFAAAGDNGASDCAPPPGYCPPGPNNADYPASSAYITAANGTELTVSDVSGTYGNEHAWSHTGGAISQLFDKPAWQTGPGVPTSVDMRMDSDMALNAGPLHPFLVYVTGSQGTGYYGIAGTSAVAPIFAGLFAIGVSQQPGGISLGQSNSAIYNDVNAGHYATDFHDVTEGCNGYLPDGTTQSCATMDWDHPTGWGSPKAASLLSHIGSHAPAGTLSGVVTDAASGQPIAGATVTVTAPGFSESRTTQDDGSYSMVLAVGSYTGTVADFGYTNGTASISIANGDTITQNFALEAAPQAILSGKVSDGSGHGYGLYAEIKASTSGFGQVADVWTDPSTGKYSVKLPKGFTYTLNVATALDGYNSATADVVLSNNTTKNFVISITSACTAPGYVFGGAGGFSQDFNGSFPPAGWTVTNDVTGSPVVWKLNTDWGLDGNWTGGTGTAATADSGNASPYEGNYDTSLITPPIDVSTLNGTILQYKANFQLFIFLPYSVLDLDITTDGGATWKNILHWTDNHGGFQALPGYDARVDLAPYLPSSGDFQLRWRYYDLTLGYDWYAQIDDVVIGSCQPLSGAMIYGQVTDANSGNGLVGATVTDEAGNSATTIANPADPDLLVGTYGFFESAGAHTLTASDSSYTPDSAPVNVNNNEIASQDFALKAGKLAVAPDSFTLHVMVNNSATAAFALKNTGSSGVHFTVYSFDAPPPATTTPAAGRGAPLHNVTGHFTAKSLIWTRAQSGAYKPVKSPRPANKVANDAPWMNITDYPGPVMDSCAATDVLGDVYSFDGLIGDTISASVYRYDPTSGSWTAVASNPIAVERPACAYINGKFYLADGWDAVSGDVTAALQIYDPVSDSWTMGTNNPAPLGGAVASVVLNGELYLIGGCGKTACGFTTVEVYDPTNDTWSAAADYPEPVAWESCGVIKAKIYCAGGKPDSGALTSAYVYDPHSNSWSSIADIPNPMWASDYVAADGKLLVSGGSIGFSPITNMGYAYDPASDSWSRLPNANDALYRGAGACGFYRIGGSDTGNFTPVASVELLPGYTPCGQPPSIPWLTMAPSSGSLAIGASRNVSLTFDGTDQKEFTTTRAYLKVTGDTPYPAKIIPLTVTWDPQPISLVLSGKASPNPVQKGGDFTYTITIKDAKADNHGAATQTKMTYKLPDGISYIASNGDAACTAPPAGSSPASSVATVEPPPGTVTCDFGTVDLGASKTETIAVRVAKAGTLTSHFEVTAREPNDSDKSTLDIKTTVIGTADVSATASGSTIHKGKVGSVKFVVSNAGPDTATNVKLHANSVGGVELTGATSGKGSCAAANGTLTCTIGEIEAGGTVAVTVATTGTKVGTATVQAQAFTSSDDPDQANNVATATVTVKATSSGGGALGWLALAVLLGLALASAKGRRG